MKANVIRCASHGNPEVMRFEVVKLGAPPPVEAATLQKMGSLYFTRPTHVTYTEKREELLASAVAVFDRVKKGAVRILIGQRYRLADVVKAHDDLEGGRTTGSSILVP